MRPLDVRHSQIARAFCNKQAGPALAAPAAAVAGPSTNFRVTINGGGNPLAGIQVMFYIRDAGGHMRIATSATNKKGQAQVSVPQGQVVSFVEPIPYSGFWIMLSDAPS